MAHGVKQFLRELKAACKVQGTSGKDLASHATEPEGVAERKGQSFPVLCRIPDELVDIPSGRKDVLVGENHPLGFSGGAACEQDVGRVVGIRFDELVGARGYGVMAEGRATEGPAFQHFHRRLAIRQDDARTEKPHYFLQP